MMFSQRCVGKLILWHTELSKSLIVVVAAPRLKDFLEENSVFLAIDFETVSAAEVKRVWERAISWEN